MCRTSALMEPNFPRPRQPRSELHQGALQRAADHLGRHAQKNIRQGTPRFRHRFQRACRADGLGLRRRH